MTMKDDDDDDSEDTVEEATNIDGDSEDVGDKLTAIIAAKAVATSVTVTNANDTMGNKDDTASTETKGITSDDDDSSSVQYISSVKAPATATSANLPKASSIKSKATLVMAASTKSKKAKTKKLTLDDLAASSEDDTAISSPDRFRKNKNLRHVFPPRDDLGVRYSTRSRAATTSGGPGGGSSP